LGVLYREAAKNAMEIIPDITHKAIYSRFFVYKFSLKSRTLTMPLKSKEMLDA
jgi:hypothetical protein